MKEDKLKLVSTQLGYDMFVVRDDHIISRSIIETGVWEKETSAVLGREIKAGMNIIEVGCNQGFHSINIARTIGPDGQLWALDANPVMGEVLNKNLQLNGLKNVSFIETGVSDRAGRFKFNMCGESNSGCSSFYDDLKYMDVEYITEVETTTLDHLFGGKRVDGIKMDIEMSELAALKGAVSILGQHKPFLVVEWNCHNICPDKDLCLRMDIELFDYLSQFGYQIHRPLVNGEWKRVETPLDLVHTVGTTLPDLLVKLSDTEMLIGEL